jgi:hypothetical protein
VCSDQQWRDIVNWEEARHKDDAEETDFYYMRKRRLQEDNDEIEQKEDKA